MDNKKRLNEVSSTSLDVREDLVKRLLSVVPEAETDGKIDWDKLKQELTGVIDESPERYNFTWNGKKQAMKLAQLPSTATLKPNKEKSKNWDTTENLYIEGDNLEVLKLLQKSYANKIKLIYIDPPYNTGKDFVYKDNFKDSLANYLEQTGQVDSDGNKLSVNTDNSGRYHTYWLNMMYPRLKLARNLLAEDGVIFISIDDSEQSNLKKIADEVFGENNLVASIAYQGLDTVKNDAKYFSNNHEYILCYSKSKDSVNIKGRKRTEEHNKVYKNYDNDPNGDYLLTPLHAKSGTENNRYEYIFSNGIKFTPPQGTFHRYSKDSLSKMESLGQIYFGANVPQKKTYLKDVSDYVKLTTFWDYKLAGSTRNSNKELAELVGQGYFQNPKPTKLLKLILNSVTDTNSYILDFFSGSSTTADAVMRLNAEDGGNRKFIMVQLPEQLSEKDVAYADGYRTIPEIAQERIRRAGDKIVDENPLFASKLDIGFKVFELDKSNIKKWNIDSTNLVDQIEMLQDNFETGSTPVDVVYEIMLKQGHSLTSHIVEENLDDSIVYTVEYGAMFIVLGNKINSSVANYIVDKIKELEIENSIVVFQDQQFESDSEKLNAIEILNENGVEYDNILSI
ncbi:site-specific DNA-methyltransferase [Erysipelothrix rhusiopathiae]|uniref:site-specific DNA-methyltransferase n=1 Tax=Erysipelothrix rhusiopathiae TaxID=1648 RepID=UPI000CA381E7|nr:site-specific DNA-methyltransferase [Erysipelothrix rhusiopathiae]ASD51136.1 type III restriction-modification system methylation subunit [Erysipelothrix phage phi1605]QDS38479.1 site-specific DNA-methyltransferase [Erysipelothrix rhusiopathiae]